MKYKNIGWKRLSLREYGGIVNYSKLNKKTNARKWHASIERCEMEKKVKYINDPHVYKNKYYT